MGGAPGGGPGGGPPGGGRGGGIPGGMPTAGRGENSQLDCNKYCNLIGVLHRLIEPL